jgi:hypothetical protein
VAAGTEVSRIVGQCVIANICVYTYVQLCCTDIDTEQSCGCG